MFSDRGTPFGYRHMNGYGSHTFKMVNDDGKVVFCKVRRKATKTNFHVLIIVKLNHNVRISFIGAKI